MRGRHAARLVSRRAGAHRVMKSRASADTAGLAGKATARAFRITSSRRMASWLRPSPNGRRPNSIWYTTTPAAHTSTYAAPDTPRRTQAGLRQASGRARSRYLCKGACTRNHTRLSHPAARGYMPSRGAWQDRPLHGLRSGGGGSLLMCRGPTRAPCMRPAVTPCDRHSDADRAACGRRRGSRAACGRRHGRRAARPVERACRGLAAAGVLLETSGNRHHDADRAACGRCPRQPHRAAGRPRAPCWRQAAAAAPSGSTRAAGSSTCPRPGWSAPGRGSGPPPPPCSGQSPGAPGGRASTHSAGPVLRRGAGGPPRAALRCAPPWWTHGPVHAQRQASVSRQQTRVTGSPRIPRPQALRAATSSRACCRPSTRAPPHPMAGARPAAP